METLAVLLIALALDWALGEPRNRWHPVAWMGRLITAWGRPGQPGPTRELLWGAGLVAFGLVLVIVPMIAIERLVAEMPSVARTMVEGGLLKLTFSLRGLCLAAAGVRRSLEAQGLDLARARAGRDLVSRSTETLSPALVASAAVESVAENLTDSVVAPLAFYLAFGLPGAYAYRFVNTADAMIGYRDPRHEQLGKAAARLDDLLNLLPSRLAALALVGAAPVVGAKAGQAWRVCWRQHGRTASPNAGWTMAAMAGALEVTLEKPGAYRLGAGPLPGPHTIGRAVRLAQAATLLFFLSVALAVALVLGTTGA